MDFRRITHPYYCDRTRIAIGSVNEVRGFVLDIGCSSGRFTKPASEYADFAVGMDINVSALKKARSSGYNYKINYVMADAQSLPYKDSTFDYVLCFDVIEHMYDDKRFLLEVKRVSKGFGTLFITTLNRTRLTTFLRKLVGRPRRFPHRIGTGFHQREYSREELERLLSSQGFEIENSYGFFLGVTFARGFRSIGISLFPKFLEKYCFGLFVNAHKRSEVT